MQKPLCENPANTCGKITVHHKPTKLQNDIIARNVAKPKVHGVAPSTIPRMRNRAAIVWCDYQAIKTETTCLQTLKAQSVPKVDNGRVQNCGQPESPKTDITSGPNI